MERIPGSDLQRLIEFAGVLEGAENHDGFVRRLLPALRELLPCELVTYNEVSPQGASAVAYPTEYEEIVQPQLEEALAVHAEHHPLVTHYRRTADRSARRISEFWSRRELHGSGLYSEVFRPVETECQMAVTIPAGASQVIGIALNRRARDFTDEEALLLGLARAHLVAAYRAAELRERLGVFEEALDSSRHAVALVDRHGHLLHASERAVALLAEYLGEVDDPPRLSAPLHDWVRQEQRGQARDEVPEAPRSLVVAGGSGRLTVRLLSAGAWGGRSALVLSEYRVAPQRLPDVGLTKRQEEVLRLLAQGRSNAEIAELLYVSVRTVRKHLERIYEKLGVHSRSAAVARVFEAMSAPESRSTP